MGYVLTFVGGVCAGIVLLAIVAGGDKSGEERE